MAILRRNQKLIQLLGGAVTFVWLSKKRILLWSGEIELDLSRVTTAKIGSLKEPEYHVPSLLKRLEGYQKSFLYNVLSMRDSFTLARVNAAIDNLKTDVSDGTLRKQPFCIMLYGYPGTGKSSFAIQIAKVLMTEMYGEFKAADMVTLNETDEYQSEFRSSHKVVLFDDIGASKYGLNDTSNPWRKIIDFVNNIKKTALNPNVEMKGKVYIEPDLVICTSNLNFECGAQISGYIPAFEAILRRLSFIVNVKSHTMVTPLEYTSHLGVVQGGSHLSHQFDYLPRGGVHPVLIPREEFIEELRVAFIEHDRDQTEFVNHFNSYFDDEILESQSGNPITSSLTQHEGRVAYYKKYVNWDRYFIEYYEEMDFDMSLLASGIVVPTYNVTQHDNTLLPIEPVAFNEAYKSISISERRRKYYSETINFANYYVGYCAAMSKDDCVTYYLDDDIIVTSRSRTSIEVHIDDFNYCYQQYLLSQDKLLGEVVLHAEGKTENVLLGAPEQFRSNPFGSEATMLEYLKYLILHDVKRLYNYQTNIKIGNYGEIDMMITLGQVTLVIECKQAFDLEFLHKGVSQVDRYTDIAEILRPDDRIIGLLYSPVGFTVVRDNRKPVADMGFKNFLDRLFYNWEGHSPAKNVMREVNEK